MTQPKLKLLVKLLKQWESEFNYKDDSQPMYGEVIRLIIAQVNREIE